MRTILCALSRAIPCIFACLFPALVTRAAEPLLCPAGAPIGSFQLTVSPPEGGISRPLITVNRLLPGYKISYRPTAINSVDKKKARIALILVPADSAKITVLDPKPAEDANEWTVPVRTSIVSVVWGPAGLDKAKVKDLVAKNDELIGELADYAQKTQATEALIQALTQEQQALDSGRNVDAAMAGFANQFPNVQHIDRTQPGDQQMLALLRGVNPALAGYDPLAQSPTQRAAQSAGIAAAVAGLFFGNTVGLAASGGALLVNMHTLLFPRTEFRSAFAQTPPEKRTQTALCGNKLQAQARTQLAFLWAVRVPDALAPEISLPKAEHLPEGAKSTFPLTVKAHDWKLAARVQDWKVVSADGKLEIPVPTRVDPDKKTIDIDLTNPKITAGPWKLAAMWDWEPLRVSGDLDVRPFATFEHAHLAPESQDRLTQSAGKVLLDLEGRDFEFVEKLQFKSLDDKFAQPEALPFHLPEGPRAGLQVRLQTQLDARPLAAGNYAFLIAQSDGKTHQIPFKVLPAPPQISNLPLRVSTGADAQRITLRGTGLDRIEGLSADKAQITLAEGKKGDERQALVKFTSDVKKGDILDLRLKVKEFQEPVVMARALEATGPKPVVSGVRVSLPPDLGIALDPGELPAGSFVSFAMRVRTSSQVTGVQLQCSEGQTVEIRSGEARGNIRLRQESPGSLFLSFDSEGVGQPGCQVMLTALTSDGGQSEARKLGQIVRIPKIESFQLTDEKASEQAYFGILKGLDLETIEKAGWDSQTGTPVDAIPAPVAGEGNKETLKVALPWPAPAPHAPLFVWLRGETKGRATTTKW